MLFLNLANPAPRFGNVDGHCQASQNCWASLHDVIKSFLFTDTTPSCQHMAAFENSGVSQAVPFASG